MFISNKSFPNERNWNIKEVLIYQYALATSINKLLVTGGSIYIYNISNIPDFPQPFAPTTARLRFDIPLDSRIVLFVIYFEWIVLDT